MTPLTWPVDMRALTITSGADRELCMAVPCVSLALYSETPLRDLSDPVSETIRRYLAFVPRGAIKTTYVAGGDDDYVDYEPGYFEPLDDEVLASLYAEIHSAAFRDVGFYGLMLSGSEEGEGSAYGVRFQGSQLEQSDFPEKSNLLRLDFPVFEDAEDVSRAVAFIADTFDAFPCFSGVCGLSFGYTYAFEPQVRERINALVMRYFGFDIAYDWTSRRMRRRIPPINWITFADDRLVAEAGGLTAIQRAVKGAEFTRLRSGVFVRGAARPPVGDVNRNAPDIGLLPSLARAMKPARFDSVEDAGMMDPDMASRWLTRFDDLPDREWANW